MDEQQEITWNASLEDIIADEGEKALVAVNLPQERGAKQRV
jgi:hypothetical protein